MTKRTSIILITAVSVLAGFAAVERADSQQTTSEVAATTRPSGSIHGNLKIAGGASLQHPDLTRVVVYVAAGPVLAKSAATRPTSASNPRAMVSQRDKSFVPNFLVVPCGTDVEFPNWDRFDHNVFSRSAAAPAFDLDRYPYGKSKTRQFDKLGVVQVFCNIHPQMRAVIFVTPDEHFTRCDAEGNFEIPDLPAGKYEIAAWQERCDEERRTVELQSSSQSLQINFTLKPTRGRALAATDDRKPTYGVERGLGVKREKLDLPVVHESHDAPEGSKP